jgi:hypothetical protein
MDRNIENRKDAQIFFIGASTAKELDEGNFGAQTASHATHLQFSNTTTNNDYLSCTFWRKSTRIELTICFRSISVDWVTLDPAAKPDFLVPTVGSPPSLSLHRSRVRKPKRGISLNVVDLSRLLPPQ